MKTKTKKSTESNWAISSDPISIDEFVKGIKKAEKGPFYTLEESKQILEQWRIERLSK
jgi:hypothetical protein